MDVEGAQEGDAASSDLAMLRSTKGMDATPLRRRGSPALRLGRASDDGSEGMAWPDPMISFAQFDAHSFFPRARFLLKFREGTAIG